MFNFLQYDERQPVAKTIQDVIDLKLPVRTLVDLFECSSDSMCGSQLLQLRVSCLLENTSVFSLNREENLLK